MHVRLSKFDEERNVVEVLDDDILLACRGNERNANDLMVTKPKYIAYEARFWWGVRKDNSKFLAWSDIYTPKDAGGLDDVDDSNWKVAADLKEGASLQWDQELLLRICDQVSAKAIMKVGWPISSRMDKLCWMGNSSDMFSVRSCWRMLSNALPNKEMVVQRTGNAQPPTPSLASGSQVWCPPEQGFIKVNVDAAFVGGQATTSLVVRDDQGHLLFLASKLISCVSPFMAEVEALWWAVGYVTQCGWRDVEWETDAKEVEKAVSVKDEPFCWYSFDPICSIRECFGFQGWKLQVPLYVVLKTTMKLSSQKPRIFCDGSSNPNMEPTCGRPLGIKFNPKTGELYIADAYFGLLKVGPNGGVAQQLATSAEGVAFRFTNALDIDTQTGVVYFTDTSMVYQRGVWIKSILAGDKTGKLMKYDPITKKVTVLLRGLAFANGVALSKDNSFILVSESGTMQILRLWLRGPKAQNLELFAQLNRFPDNIKTNEKGEFWIALNSGREALQNLQGENKLQGHGQVGNAWLINDPVAIKFDREGKTVKVLDGKGGSELNSVSEVEEHDGSLWIGSAVKHYVCAINA
ncbi:hypothetical protein FNV43_RR26984 [Rhamnella rubrinervis]|uniref:Uncharacterized protein n=1 Tax=Rhamnella rubrinervis TaxID=2594499 RepID=A0A8K0DJS2_9ROSA|nr:hypothetical protein FNV43_RR26984 [Rhamnella rubrinervis]